MEKYKDKDWLYQKYIIEELSMPEIAKICKIDKTMIYRHLKRCDIPVRTHSEAARMWANHYPKTSRGENSLRWKGGSSSHWGRQAHKAWEEYWGEEVPEGYLIHHNDGDITNNYICNLALLTFKYHLQLHKGGVPRTEETRKKISEGLLNQIKPYGGKK